MPRDSLDGLLCKPPEFCKGSDDVNPGHLGRCQKSPHGGIPPKHPVPVKVIPGCLIYLLMHVKLDAETLLGHSTVCTSSVSVPPQAVTTYAVTILPRLSTSVLLFLPFSFVHVLFLPSHPFLRHVLGSPTCICM